LLKAWLSAFVSQTIELAIFAENFASDGGTTFLPDSATITAVSRRRELMLKVTPFEAG
jgi:hypothetical protein